MKGCHRIRGCVIALGCALVLLAGQIIEASPDGSSIAVNFGADEPNGARSDVTGAAGVLGTVNWNNVDGAAGTLEEVIRDVAGKPIPEPCIVTWSSNNTWSSTGRGEENNTAPDGNDRNLMTGYVDSTADTGPVIEVSGIAAGVYDVYVYMKGGVVGRGGDYFVNGQVQSHIDTGPFDGTYVEGSEGDYLVFRNVSGSEFMISSIPTEFRAPINAVELVFKGPAVEVPDLATWGMISLTLGALLCGSLLLLRRRNALLPAHG